MNKDTIIGIVGAVVLIAAMVGVFKYEGSQTQAGLGANRFDVAWATADENGPSLSGSTPVGEAATETLVVERANLTNARFTLTWTAGPTSTDTLNLTVTPPSGSGLVAQSVEGDVGELMLDFGPLNVIPPEGDQFANDPADAEARLAQQYTKTLGSGNWTVSVTFVSAQGLSPVPGAPDPSADTQVPWDVNTVLTAYAPDVQPAQ